ncbi:MAG TPA: antibiotic biosynthesis monooxygenase [Ideonella sp.]|uniref:antibiotic biosynthesis monooxygenase n=1 Tax=Ideonella sp. TaxID=1929293 RepID=UPI002B85B5F5|nr:antibiotic biosynthesis monooxygenase [Ideonella sp.]HSI49985.1 antibiotic biosynthesis monooxygenase [Ideonella sp.]
MDKPPQKPPARATDERRPELRSADLRQVAEQALPQSEMVTAVIRQRVNPALHTEYEAWLHRIILIAARFPGHRGVHVVPPAPGETLYTIALQFDTIAHADDWFRSEARQSLLRDAEPLLAAPEEVKTVTGLEFWFEPRAAMPAPRRAKQALATLSVIFPLTTVLGLLIGPLVHGWPTPWGRLAGNLLVSTATVFLMTYLIMPRYTRLLSRWLSR